MPDSVLKEAVLEIEERIGDIEEEQSDITASQTHSYAEKYEQNTFDDSALRDLSLLFSSVRV